MQRRHSLSAEAEELLSRRAPDPRVVAKNIIKKYGRAEFHKLVQLFQDNAPTKKIMVAYLVTRQRVAQWKDALGTQTVTFEPKSDIHDLLPPPDVRANRRISA